MDKYKQDIHKIEGLWFCDPEFVMMHGIPIKAFYQKPGDIVILGPGCLHWVRSDGVAVNSAWNVCDNQIELIQEIHNRFEVNLIIKIRLTNKLILSVFYLLKHYLWIY
jgi:histone demethylase